jgi:hypothetical protein
LLEFTDDVQPDIGEFILQQVQEELKKMIDGGTMAKERCKTRDLVCKGSPHMLRTVLTEIPNKRYYPGNDDLRFQQFRKTFRESRIKTPHWKLLSRYLVFALQPLCELRLRYLSITGHSD